MSSNDCGEGWEWDRAPNPESAPQGVFVVARRVSEVARLFTLAYASGFHGPMNHPG